MFSRFHVQRYVLDFDFSELSLHLFNKTLHFYSCKVTTSRTTVRQTGQLQSLWKGTLVPTSLNVSDVHA